MKGYKTVAAERIRMLFESALANAKNRPAMAVQNAEMLREISQKYRIPLSGEISRSFCKKCKSFIVPGAGARVRAGKTGLRITCMYCGHVYRKIFS